MRRIRVMINRPRAEPFPVIDLRSPSGRSLRY